MSQFRNKAEAQQAIQDMKKRAASTRALPWGTETDAAQYDEEAARIEALLPTLPDAPRKGCDYCAGLLDACPSCFA